MGFQSSPSFFPSSCPGAFLFPALLESLKMGPGSPEPVFLTFTTSETGVIELNNPRLPIWKMRVSRSASWSPVPDAKAQDTRRTLEGPLNRRGAGSTWDLGVLGSTGNAISLLLCSTMQRCPGPQSNLLYRTAKPSKPPEGPAPCLVDPTGAAFKCPVFLGFPGYA